MSNFPKNFETEIVNYDIGDMLRNNNMSGKVRITNTLAFVSEVIDKGRNSPMNFACKPEIEGSGASVSVQLEFSNDGVEFVRSTTTVSIGASAVSNTTQLFRFVRIVVTATTNPSSYVDFHWCTGS